jgi:hypothetical protein
MYKNAGHEVIVDVLEIDDLEYSGVERVNKNSENAKSNENLKELYEECL